MEHEDASLRHRETVDAPRITQDRRELPEHGFVVGR
jgi:hypothetical protein